MSSGAAVPNEVLSVLTPEELVLRSWNKNEWNIYATQYRIFLHRVGIFRSQLVEAAYSHISSVESRYSRDINLIVAAILLFFMAGLFSWIGVYATFFLFWAALFVLGGIALLWYFLRGKHFYILHIVGRPPLEISAEISDVMRFAREKRSQEVHMRQQPSEKETTIVKEVVMIPCSYCSSLMPQTSTFCPNCGARRRI